MKVSVVTLTSDRPWCMMQCNAYVSRQTRPPDEWIIVDGGYAPASVPAYAQHVRLPYEPDPFVSFAKNMQAAAEAVTGDLIVFMEDDDWYAPTHIERMAALHSEDRWKKRIAGDPKLRWYHVPSRRWWVHDNESPPMAQMVMGSTFLRKHLAYRLEKVQLSATKGLDRILWTSSERACPLPTKTCVGLKGLPGRPGIGTGHREEYYLKWEPDPDGRMLRSWIGEDAEVYL